MISASKTTFRVNNLKILRPKVRKNLTNLGKTFCKFEPWCTALDRKFAVQFHQCSLTLKLCWILPNNCAFGEWQKKLSRTNVAEIDPKCQFHTHFMNTFFVQKCFTHLVYTVCVCNISWKGNWHKICL